MADNSATTPSSATRDNLNATGQPDTPIEVLTDLLSKALQCKDPSEAQALVKGAHGIASGLDPYLDSISTKPSEVQALLHILRASNIAWGSSN